jgi:hypothetical protein
MHLPAALRSTLAGLLIAAPAGAYCPGDCDLDGVVSISDLVRTVDIVLDGTTPERCRAVDTDRDTDVTIDEVVAAVNAARAGCPRPTPTPALRFTGPTYLPVVVGRLRAADVNGDGATDIVGLNEQIEVFLNRGTGSLERHGVYPAIRPRFVIATDLSGDGVADLVAVNPRIPSAPLAETPSLSLLLGRGDGTFEDARTHLVPADAAVVAAGDTDGDGLPDLVTVAGYGDMYRFAGRGGGDVAAAQSIGRGVDAVTLIAVADLDGDANGDLVAGSQGPGAAPLVVRLARGDGTFGPEVSFAPIFGEPALADLDGDGFVDILVAPERADLGILLGNGDGSFQPARQYLSGYPREVDVGDLNGDGALDIVTVDFGGGGLTIFLGSGDGRFRLGALLADPEYNFESLALADLDRDGAADVIVSEIGTGLAIFLSRP